VCNYRKLHNSTTREQLYYCVYPAVALLIGDVSTAVERDVVAVIVSVVPADVVARIIVVRRRPVAVARAPVVVLRAAVGCHPVSEVASTSHEVPAEPSGAVGLAAHCRRVVFVAFAVEIKLARS